MNLAQRADDASRAAVSVVIRRSGAVEVLILAGSDEDERRAQRLLNYVRRLWAGSNGVRLA